MPQAGFKPGTKGMSPLEFETWQLRPLGHHGRLTSGFTITQKVLRVTIANNEQPRTIEGNATRSHALQSRD